MRLKSYCKKCDKELVKTSDRSRGTCSDCELSE